MRKPNAAYRKAFLERHPHYARDWKRKKIGHQPLMNFNMYIRLCNDLAQITVKGSEIYPVDGITIEVPMERLRD